MTAIEHFDPQSVPAVRVDHHLPPVPQGRLTAQALRDHFAQPPPWTPEIVRELRLPGRQPAEAAVLVPLVMRESQLTLILTERGRHLSSHSGQIAFPGDARMPAILIWSTPLCARPRRKLVCTVPSLRSSAPCRPTSPERPS